MKHLGATKLNCVVLCNASLSSNIANLNIKHTNVPIATITKNMTSDIYKYMTMYLDPTHNHLNLFATVTKPEQGMFLMLVTIRGVNVAMLQFKLLKHLKS